MALRKLVLSYGLPRETAEETDHVHKKCSLRALVWKILLGALYMDEHQYLELLQVSVAIFMTFDPSYYYNMNSNYIL
jgi:hypothetical protein